MIVAKLEQSQLLYIVRRFFCKERINFGASYHDTVEIKIMCAQNGLTKAKEDFHFDL